MAIEKSEQGGINFKHRNEANKEKAELKSKRVGGKTVTKSDAPEKVQDIIKRGGKPVATNRKSDPVKNESKIESKSASNNASKNTSKTLSNTNISDAAKSTSDLQVFGDGDAFKLICKASSESEGWMKSTKAMDVGKGCIVQVTTQQRNKDGSYAIAEAVTFVPGVMVREFMDNENNITSRAIIGTR